jgi:hypothetical protein
MAAIMTIPARDKPVETTSANEDAALPSPKLAGGLEAHQ